MPHPEVETPPVRTRSGKRIMWAIGVLVLLTLAFALYTMSEQPADRPSPGLSQESRPLG